MEERQRPEVKRRCLKSVAAFAGILLLLAAIAACAPPAAAPGQAAPVTVQAGTPAAGTQSMATALPTSQFRVESICPPADPHDLTANIKEFNKFQGPSSVTAVALSGGRTFNVEVYGQQQVGIDKNMLAKVIEYAEALQTSNFVSIDGAQYLNSSKRKSVGTGSKIILHDGQKSPCLGSNGIAFTSNGTSDPYSESEVPLRIIETGYGGKNTNALAYAIGTEAVQQTYFQTGFQEVLPVEAMANGTGFAISVIQGLRSKGTPEDHWYQEYVTRSAPNFITTPAGQVDFAVLTPESFKSLVQTMSSSLVIYWN